MLVYCDSVIFIYLFDHTGHFNIRATSRMAAFAAAKDRIAISHLVRLEYRIAPLRSNDAVKLGIFDAFCVRPDVQFLPISTAVFERATAIRAAFNFKLGDSLHLSAAVEGGCDRFLTNDNRLSRFTDIAVEVLP